MKNKRTLMVIGSVALVLVLAAIPFMTACAKPAPAPTPEVIEWKIATYMTQVSPFTQADQRWAKELERLSNGRIKVTWFFGGSLVGGKEELGAVRTGVCDQAQPAPGYTPAELPLFGITSLPMLAPPRIAHECLIMNEVVKLPEMIAELEKQGVVLAYWESSPATRLMGNVAIRKVEDFKDIRVRSYGKVVDLVKAVGGVPMSTPIAEAWTALNTGLSDVNAQSGRPSFYTHKTYEISKYYMQDIPLAGAGNVGIINKASWDALPDDIKAIIVALREQMPKFRQDALESPEDIAKWEAAFREAGVEFISTPPEEIAKLGAASKPIWDEWVAKNKDVGAKKVLDEFLRLKPIIIAKFPYGVK